jgi:hypothetical protein
VRVDSSCSRAKVVAFSGRPAARISCNSNTRVVAAGPIAPLRRLRRGLSAKAGHELRDGATGVCAMMLLMSVAHDEANGKRYHL